MNWDAAAKDYGAASTNSFRTMVSTAIKKVKDAAAANGEAAPATTPKPKNSATPNSEKGRGRKRKVADADAGAEKDADGSPAAKKVRGKGKGKGKKGDGVVESVEAATGGVGGKCWFLGPGGDGGAIVLTS